MNIKISSIFLLILILFVSCKPKADINYMQNVEEIAMQASAENLKTTIQPGDQLIILITAKDMDVVKPFNQNYSSGEITQYTLPSGNTVAQGQNVSSGPTYIVDSSGNINFPIIGQMNTTGKTTETFRDELRDELKRYIKDPIVNIKTTNYRITVLGEVNRPGTFVVPDGQITLLSALGLAGDLTIYGVRDNVLVLRNIDGQTSKQVINLKDANFVNSPYFYLKQNDVIVVGANATKQKISRQDPNTSIYIAVASVVIGLLAIIIK